MKQLEVDINGIMATVHECGNDFIICCHGLYSSRKSRKYEEIARQSCNYGISCIRFDFRGCGESQGRFVDSILTNRIRDVKEVTEYVRKNYGGKIALIGSSFGGMVAIAYAYMEGIKPVVLISTPYAIDEIGGKFAEDARKYDILEMASHLSHVMIIHGRRDEIVPIEHAEKIYSKLRQPKKMVIVETDHSLTNENERRKAIEEAISWISHHI